MKNQAYRMTMLFDFYGDLLTDRQKDFYDLYYNDDLSLAEIAEHYDITRQGVRDIIVRAERTLVEIEEKTGLIRRYLQTREATARIRALYEELGVLNRDRFRSEDLNGLCRRLDEAITQLERE